jgi:hypothetical protein
MATGTIILPPNSTGQAVGFDTRASDSAYMQDAVLYGPDGTPISRVAPGGASRSALDVNIASSNSGLAARTTNTFGAAPGTIALPNTGNVANTTVTVPVGSAGNVTVDASASAYVGSFVFEASSDGGTTWSPIAMGREDGSAIDQGQTLSITAAYSRLWTTALPGITHFRVRATAWTSGTLTVGVTPGPFLTEPPPFNVALIDGSKLTYVGQQSGAQTTQASAFAGIIGALVGSTTKLIRLLRFELSLRSSTSTAGGSVPAYLMRTTTPYSGGTSSAGVVMPMDPFDPAPTASILAYTAAPYGGVAPANFFMQQVYVPANTGNSGGVGFPLIQETWGNRAGKAPVLRGAQQFAIALGATPGAPLAFSFTFEWTEEPL